MTGAGGIRITTEYSMRDHFQISEFASRIVLLSQCRGLSGCLSQPNYFEWGTRMLATNGGKPVRAKPWPIWPRYTDNKLLEQVKSVLKSGRWTISGPYNGQPLVERTFAQAWADFHDTPYCVPTANGSSALLIALEALDVGAGDEVIVPCWTWVATATAVLRVNATPVFVDVSPTNYCMSVEAVERAITPRTRAIIPVHLHHSMVDMEPLLELAGRHNVPVIEDTAQAHGAIYAGKRAGTFGALGTFSFQQSKVLTCGEGGAVITSQAELYERLFALRADSRSWRENPRPEDDMQLVPTGRVMGANYCLSDIHAALLLAQLPELEEQLTRQARNAERLEKKLTALGPFSALQHPDKLERRTVYEFLIKIDPEALCGVSPGLFGRTVKAESGLSWYPPDTPLICSPFYCPSTKKRFRSSKTNAGELSASASDFPVAMQGSQNSLVCHHSALLASEADIDDIVRAFEKVLSHIDELRQAEQRNQSRQS